VRYHSVVTAVFTPRCEKSTKAMSWVPTTAAALATRTSQVRVALQLSGHLRNLCDSPSNFAPLAALVAACRAVTSCDLFVHTWDELHAHTPTWHTWYPSDVPNLGQSSRPCVQQLTSALAPMAVEVERQVSRRSANETWIVAAGRHRETHVSLAGLRSAIEGVAAAARLRQREERSGRVAPYDVAVRVRPDLYQRRNARKNRGRGERYRGVPINQVCTVPSAAWPVIVSRGRCETCVRGCDDETRPGNKSGDMCFWSSPPTAIDRLVQAWDASADEFLDANLCWQRSSPQPLAQREGGRRRARVAAECAHPETQWDPSAAELILVAAAGREHLSRTTLESGGAIARTARCT
jgi:hypothetical protein